MPIFDQGYQHWSGKLSGHAWRWLAITRHGVRAGMKSRILRIVLLLAWTPAAALAFVLCLWGLAERKSDLVAPFMPLLTLLGRQVVADPRHYRVEVWTVCYDTFLALELRLSMILILLVGPNLISQDLRFNALPLYFSRPLRRIDYFLGKLGIIAAFLGMVVILPCLVAYVLGLLFSLDVTIVRDTYRVLLSSLLYGGIVAVSAGLLVLALSSLSRNSRYIALFWLGIWFVSSITATVLEGVARDQRFRATYAAALDPSLQRVDWRNMTPQERARFQRGLQRAHEKAMADFQEVELRASRTDWRPLVSYTSDLSRLGRQLLGTDASWEALSKIQPPSQRQQFLLAVRGPQHPWYWSAAVLAGLLGLSLCILNLNVKSLDRLK